MERSDAFAAGQASEKLAKRDPTWNEVERLQRMCKALVDVNNRLAERLEEAHYTAHAHMHDGLGRIGVPPRQSDPFMNYPATALRVADHPIR